LIVWTNSALISASW